MCCQSGQDPVCCHHVGVNEILMRCTYVPKTSFMSYLSSTVGVLFTLTSSLGFSLGLALPNCIPRGMVDAEDALCWSLVMDPCLRSSLNTSLSQNRLLAALAPSLRVRETELREGRVWSVLLCSGAPTLTLRGTFHWISAPLGDIITVLALHPHHTGAESILLYLYLKIRPLIVLMISVE